MKSAHCSSRRQRCRSGCGRSASWRHMLRSSLCSSCRMQELRWAYCRTAPLLFAMAILDAHLGVSRATIRCLPVQVDEAAALKRYHQLRAKHQALLVCQHWST